MLVAYKAASGIVILDKQQYYSLAPVQDVTVTPFHSVLMYNPKLNAM